ncbi:hypothetical protein EQ718_01810 [Paracoccus versutus]|uniref:Uncharacterized protein n=1 Tax=Paracoccus versutus TaxID=34007 RepID=A0AAQ0HHI5_PARVE|nr:hypothetical protein ATH84_101822 [Paracoccus versutus]WEJ77697.1 hypothetical protein EQ718_01810 [Paracoccus versutus]
MRMISPLCLALQVLAGCEAAPDGDRQYGFRNGRIIVLEPQRTVVRFEGAVCALHHRDIALIYASAD